jgi:ribosomal protein S18 acetylase RimI-like enzyme
MIRNASAGLSRSEPRLERAEQETQERAVTIRSARPTDIPDLMRMKLALAAADDAVASVRATPEDWNRDLFGSAPRFVAFIATLNDLAVGMATCSDRYVTGWIGPTVYLQDLFVDPVYRHRGIGAALMARVAAHAKGRGSPIIELNMRADNPAGDFYQRHGFQRVDQCAVYVAGAHTVNTLAKVAGDEQTPV